MITHGNSDGMLRCEFRYTNLHTHRIFTLMYVASNVVRIPNALHLMAVTVTWSLRHAGATRWDGSKRHGWTAPRANGRLHGTPSRVHGHAWRRAWHEWPPWRYAPTGLHGDAPRAAWRWHGPAGGQASLWGRAPTWHGPRRAHGGPSRPAHAAPSPGDATKGRTAPRRPWHGGPAWHADAWRSPSQHERPWTQHGHGAAAGRTRWRTRRDAAASFWRHGTSSTGTTGQFIQSHRLHNVLSIHSQHSSLMP